MPEVPHPIYVLHNSQLLQSSTPAPKAIFVISCLRRWCSRIVRSQLNRSQKYKTHWCKVRIIRFYNTHMFLYACIYSLLVCDLFTCVCVFKYIISQQYIISSIYKYNRILHTLYKLYTYTRAGIIQTYTHSAKWYNNFICAYVYYCTLLYLHINH